MAGESLKNINANMVNRNIVSYKYPDLPTENQSYFSYQINISFSFYIFSSCYFLVLYYCCLSAYRILIYFKFTFPYLVPYLANSLAA